MPQLAFILHNLVSNTFSLEYFSSEKKEEVKLFLISLKFFSYFENKNKNFCFSVSPKEKFIVSKILILYSLF